VGLRAMVLPRPLPTPVLAYAIRRLGCVAGVMVTASHNPPQDNGYKVYLGDGSQIVPPADTEISARIDAVGPLTGIASEDGWERLGDDVLRSYLSDVSALVGPSGPRDLRIVYTPLHGVGGDAVQSVLRRCGFAEPLVVPAQADPDPDFSTVAFPNPEEPGAMDLATALAVEVEADLVVANDPDADRCAVAVPTTEGWRMLRGDEVGALLADVLLGAGVKGVYATTIVSSSLLGRMAAAHGQEYRETLTGFKWLGRIDGLAFAYEEALGYCVAPDLVRDKDGVSALLRVVELAAALKHEGRTLGDRLDDLARTYGVHATDQLSVRVSDQTQIEAVMTRLRAGAPSRLGGLLVEQVEDLSDGLGGLPPTEGVRYRLADSARVVVRPSGTEPKVKCYLEVVVPVAEGAESDITGARALAARQLEAIRQDLTAGAFR
jgi:phosphomannomutase